MLLVILFILGTVIGIFLNKKYESYFGDSILETTGVILELVSVTGSIISLFIFFIK